VTVLVLQRESRADLVQHLVARHSRAGRAVKRLFDVAFAAVALLLAAPLLALVALLIRLDSPGPVLFRQRRMGLGHRPFVISKLRTMDRAGRVTRVGRLLRPTGIDELPQLWHVLTGQMSVVGPRPEVLDRVPRWDRELPDYWARHLMRPGITGWAQVNGLRGDISPIPERLRHDLHYLSTWTLALDAQILWRTFATVWRDTARTYRR
jgi:lipopolysaccharide/colanic/teichoic acid biosynthesis glycosyltransferase